MPCPACRQPVDAIRAAGIDLDGYDFGRTKLQYCCPNCLARLEQVVPFMIDGPGWHWQLNHECLAARLETANQHDHHKETSQSSSPEDP